MSIVYILPVIIVKVTKMLIEKRSFFSGGPILPIPAVLVCFTSCFLRFSIMVNSQAPQSLNLHTDQKEVEGCWKGVWGKGGVITQWCVLNT